MDLKGDFVGSVDMIDSTGKTFVRIYLMVEGIEVYVDVRYGKNYNPVGNVFVSILKRQ